MRFLLLIPVLLALVGMEIFIGGARLAYAIPGVCLIALAGLLSALPRHALNPRANVWALLTALVFSAYILVRNRFSEVDYIGRLQFFIMAGCLIIYLLFALFLTRPQDRKVFFYVLMVLALSQVVIGMVQFLGNNQWMPLPWAQRRDDAWRASGLFISPNHFAGYLEIITLMAVSLVVWGRSAVTVRLLIGYVACVCIAGIALSGSRGGYLSLTFGMLVLMGLTLVAWHRLRHRHFALIASLSSAAVIALFAGIVVLMFQSPTVRERVMTINDTENMRFLLWDSALQQFSNNPVFGTGAFSFLYYGRLYRNPTVQNDPIHVHNDYLQLLADYGLVGISLFAILLAVHLLVGSRAFQQLVRSNHRSGDTQSDALALNIGALSCVAAYIVHSIVDFNMQIPVNGVLMGVVFAVLVSSKRSFSDVEEDSPAPKSLIFFRLFLPAASVALLVYALPLIRGEYFGERARIALRDGHALEAFGFAAKGIESEKMNPDLYYYYGEAALQAALQNVASPAESAKAGVYAFSKGLEVFPQDSRLAVKLGQAYANAGDYFESANAISLAEELDPNSAFVFAYRGIIEYAAGYYDDAEAAFQQSIELGGEGADISRNGLQLIAKIRAELDKQGPVTAPQIEEMIKAANAQSPTEETSVQDPAQQDTPPSEQPQEAATPDPTAPAGDSQ